MAVSTSINGDVQFSTGGSYTQLDEVTKWSFKAEVNKVEYASNKTSGVKKKLAGIKSAAGSVEGVYNPNAPITAQIQEDDLVTLRNFFVAAHYIEIPALIVDIEFEEDIDGGEIIGWTVSYDATAAWTYPSALGALVAKSARREPMKDSLWENIAADMGLETEEELINLKKITQLAARYMKTNPEMVAMHAA